MSVDTDMALILADALALGLAWSGAYTPAAGGGAVAVTVSPVDVPQPNIEDVTGEVQRRAATVAIQGSLLTACARKDTLVISGGPYAGSWVVGECESNDAACWIISIRAQDVEVASRAAGLERMPHG